MKRLTLLLTAALFSASAMAGSAVGRVDSLSVIPYPRSVELADDSFKITPKTVIAVADGDEKMMDIARYFNEKFSRASGFSLPVREKGRISLKIVADSLLGDEGYRLRSGKKGVAIEANGYAGLFYGMQTLLQMLPPEVKSLRPVGDVEWSVPGAEIRDVPQFAWRGMMLDVSRHWFTKEEVMEYIDQIAEYKMNVFHWHLTDDQGWRLEIKSLPRLTEIGAWRAPRVGQWWHREPQRKGEEATYGGYYSHEDVREVLEYAARRYVRVIPEIDVPGHSVATLVAYPQMACMKAPDAVGVGNKFYREMENSLCVGKDYTFEFMDKVLTEVAELFPDEYVHIGGDECYKGFWQKCPDCRARMQAEGLKNVNELQSYFIRRMETMLKAKGKKLIGWDEINEGGLAPDATVMSWRGMRGGTAAAKAGHKVIMTPNNHCYIDLYQGEPTVEPDTYSMCRLSDSYAFDPVPDGVPDSMILGGQGNLWAESVPTFRHAQYMTWPRGWAIAEVLWSGPGARRWNDFVHRVECHFQRADNADVNYARSMYNAVVTPYMMDGRLQVELGCEVDGTDIYYTFDNTDPDDHTARYTAPLSIPLNATWLRIATYRDGKPSGKVITLTVKELAERAAKDRRKAPVGNLDL